MSVPGKGATRAMGARWLAWCLTAGMIGTAPYSLAGILQSIEVLGAIITSVVVVVVPSAAASFLILVPAIRGRRDVRRRWVVLAAVTCGLMIAAIGTALDVVGPSSYWIPTSGLGMAAAIVILVGTTFARRPGPWRPAAAISVACLVIATLYLAATLAR